MKYCNQIVTNLERKIQTINFRSNNVLEEIEMGIFHSKKTLRKLRARILSKGFLTLEDECLFFKSIKIIPSGYLIYYLALDEFELKKPKHAEKMVKTFIESKITKYQKYYKKHQNFYQYLQRNRTDKDLRYFLRSVDYVNFHPDSLTFFTDEEFSTSHDYIAAKFFAHKLLIERLYNELRGIENPNANLGIQIPTQLRWTDKIVDLTELIYALHETGSINHGKISIKELVAIFQQVLNVDLGDCYRNYTDICSRKTNRTKFLDLMAKTLRSKMNQADE